MTQEETLISLCSFVPFGPARIKLLLSYFKSARRVWAASAKSFKKIGLGEKRTSEFLQYRENFDPKEYFNRLKKLKIGVVTFKDKNYPENLKDLSDAPMVLYFKGNIKSAQGAAIAVVGSRKMTSYGREVTEKFAGELASFGITIVSGLARGIDTSAHKSALAVGGKTVAVLGCGLDSVYPPENFKLADEIVKKGGALISEYPLGHPALPINFASRNRIISGLSRAVLVIEGAEKSGTLLTASAAADQGRTVFAIPGQITSPLSAAPLFLIKNGAKTATRVGDILEEIDLQIKVDREEVEKIMPTTAQEEEILSYLTNEPLHLDELARISTLDISDISARLTVMELKGMVKNMGGGVYKKV